MAGEPRESRRRHFRPRGSGGDLRERLVAPDVRPRVGLGDGNQAPAREQLCSVAALRECADLASDPSERSDDCTTDNSTGSLGDPRVPSAAVVCSTLDEVVP